MMKYIEAPNEWDQEVDSVPSVFLAGGIVDCVDWQSDIVQRLATHDIAILNPRRLNFPIDDPNAAKEQIRWEYDALRAVDMISFWFSSETLNPIVLYELGTWTAFHYANGGTPSIVIGIHVDYKRRVDIEIQTALMDTGIPIVYSLGGLAEEIVKGLDA